MTWLVTYLFVGIVLAAYIRVRTGPMPLFEWWIYLFLWPLPIIWVMLTAAWDVEL